MRKILFPLVLLVSACVTQVPPPTPAEPVTTDKPWGYVDLCNNPNRTPDSVIHCGH